jgi:hypothetical protein
VVNLFLVSEPLRGRRQVRRSARRTRIDFAHCIQEEVEAAREQFGVGALP